MMGYGQAVCRPHALRPLRGAAGGGGRPRRWPLEAYLTGLLLSGERKSVEPMAAEGRPVAGESYPAIFTSLRGDGALE